MLPGRSTRRRYAVTPRPAWRRCSTGRTSGARQPLKIERQNPGALMSDSLSEEILNYPRLFDELGFRIISQMYEPEHFGNSLVLLENPQLRVMFVRDRGQIRADIASPLEPEDWHDVNFVLEAVSPHHQTQVDEGEPD